MPGTRWHTAQPAFVKISVIGSFPVTSGTMLGTSTVTGETGTGVSTEGVLKKRRANQVPSSTKITMRAVIDLSGMEPTPLDGLIMCSYENCPTYTKPATLTSWHPSHSEIPPFDPRNMAQLKIAPLHATRRVNPPMIPLVVTAFDKTPGGTDYSLDSFDNRRDHTSQPLTLPHSPPYGKHRTGFSRPL